MQVDRLGILAGLLSGAFWGFSFLVPKLFDVISPAEIALGRFTWFGLLSLLTLSARKGFRKNAPVFRYWKEASILSLSGYSLYYFLLVYGIQLSGIPISSLIVGLIPVTVALISRDSLHRPKLFVSGVFMILAGMLVLNSAAFSRTDLGTGKIKGLILCLVCLTLWSYFAVRNAKFFKAHSEMDSLEWSGVLGIYSWSGSLIIFGIVSIFSLDPAGAHPLPLLSLKFLALTALLGVFSTFIATRLWNFASRRLPTGLVAQLIVSETLFALLYGYIYEGTTPILKEWISMILIVGGVLLAVRSYRLNVIFIPD